MFLLGIYGVDNDSALSVMLISRLLVILLSLIGAGFYLSDRKDLPMQVASPEKSGSLRVVLLPDRETVRNALFRLIIKVMKVQRIETTGTLYVEFRGN